MWATHLDKGFQLSLTSFGDLKHEEVKRYKRSIWMWHSCIHFVTGTMSAVSLILINWNIMPTLIAAVVTHSNYASTLSSSFQNLSNKAAVASSKMVQNNSSCSALQW